MKGREGGVKRGRGGQHCQLQCWCQLHIHPPVLQIQFVHEVPVEYLAMQAELGKEEWKGGGGGSKGRQSTSS